MCIFKRLVILGAYQGLCVMTWLKMGDFLGVVYFQQTLKVNLWLIYATCGWAQAVFLSLVFMDVGFWWYYDGQPCHPTSPMENFVVSCFTYIFKFVGDHILLLLVDRTMVHENGSLHGWTYP